ncbi:hypothetical protein NQ317_000035 [Molorchus minor]|uniref:Uncharacterized protein n=1 Tax=Molorchus minor TaxID=1323400 RepID=A0ABQ9IUN2_9CUCU|nr:hypothetical protein NQ317_000035 [Molorchus minor]
MDTFLEKLVAVHRWLRSQMGNLQDFPLMLTRWSFGVTILVGLVASEFSSYETMIAILVAALSSTLSGNNDDDKGWTRIQQKFFPTPVESNTIMRTSIHFVIPVVHSILCGSVINGSEEQFRIKRLPNILYFLILWLDILTNLVAAATCARLASATIDYISKGRFREFLFGLEQHSLGEPWPDVLGVTIVVVVTILFMMGLENSPAISSVLFFALLCNFTFFTTIGSFHTVTKFWKWCENFKIHFFRKILKASAICSFAFVHNIPKTERNCGLKIFTMVFSPLFFYIVTAVIFSLMTHYRELIGSAIPLVQVFQNRDVDWARPIIAAFTISVVCLVLTEVLPTVYFLLVKLASKEWRVLVPSLQYQSPLTGGSSFSYICRRYIQRRSLAAILAFACPLSHLIKLLNTSCLVRCVLVSCQLMFNRYKPDVRHDCLVYNTNIQYSKLNKNGTRPTNNNYLQIKERIKSIFVRKPKYIHHVNSPKNTNHVIGDMSSHKLLGNEERECLLLDDYSNKSVNIDVNEDSESENDADDMVLCSDGEDSGSSTDIDLVVEEYREGLKASHELMALRI